MLFAEAAVSLIHSTISTTIKSYDNFTAYATIQKQEAIIKLSLMYPTILQQLKNDCEALTDHISDNTSRVITLKEHYIGLVEDIDLYLTLQPEEQLRSHSQIVKACNLIVDQYDVIKEMNSLLRKKIMDSQSVVEGALRTLMDSVQQVKHKKLIATIFVGLFSVGIGIPIVVSKMNKKLEAHGLVLEMLRQYDDSYKQINQGIKEEQAYWRTLSEEFATYEAKIEQGGPSLDLPTCVNQFYAKRIQAAKEGAAKHVIILQEYVAKVRSLHDVKEQWAKTAAAQHATP